MDEYAEQLDQFTSEMETVYNWKDRVLTAFSEHEGEMSAKTLEAFRAEMGLIQQKAVVLHAMREANSMRFKARLEHLEGEYYESNQ